MFPELTGKKFNFLCFAEILFSCYQVNLCGSYEGDPLDPHFRGIFINLSRGAIAFWGRP
jgi:hypothetical protein